MNIVKTVIATILALVYLIFAIPLAFLILLLYVVFGLPTYYLVDRVNAKSKAYKVYEAIIGPLADCFVKIMDFISY